MQKPLEVELVGHSWLLNLIGPALVAVAAIVAAGVAAYTAAHNHRAQLANDRALRERDHTRSVLDAAIENVIETFEAVSRLSIAIDRAESARPPLESLQEQRETPESKKQDANEKLLELAKDLRADAKAVALKLVEMHAANARLKLRFGSLAPIPKTHDQLTDAYRGYLRELSKGIPGNRTESQRDDSQQAMEAGTDRFSTLMVLCERWLTAS